MRRSCRRLSAGMSVRLLYVAGAVNIPDVFHHLATRPPGGLKEMQEPFAALFGEAGFTGEETAVVYEEGFSPKTPRGYWILKHLGYPKTAAPKGDMREWRPPTRRRHATR